MRRDPVGFLFLNIGHFLDHLFMLIFASAAALRLSAEWGLTYAELIPYATPGFLAFGLGAVLAGWVADKWSREGMMVVFFIGIGASSLLAGLADDPVQLGIALTLVGIFAAIYHPVGLAMVVEGREKTGIALAVNGIFGNMGVASAALLTGFLIDQAGWRSAFYLPGVVSIVLGALYLRFIRAGRHSRFSRAAAEPSGNRTQSGPAPKEMLIRVFGVIFFTTAVGGLIFQSTTFALPKIFQERLTELAGTATMIGWYTFLVFTLAALAQLVIGHLLDNHPVRRVFAAVALVQVLLLAVMTQLSGVAALITAVGFMFVVFGQIPINDVLVGRLARSEWRSRAYALRYLVTFSVMASAIPLVGWIQGNWGFGRLFVVLAGAAMMLYSAVLLLPETDLMRPESD